MGCYPIKIMETSNQHNAWPRIEWEANTWIPSAQFGVRASKRERELTYYSAVPPMIGELTPQIGEVAELAELAALELASFDAEQGVRLKNFGPVLLRSEAAASSQIENLTASARSVFSADLGIKTGRNAQLIAANTRAMTAALALSDSISTDSILEMHRTLMNGQPQHTPGEFRAEPVWIGTSSLSPIGAEFVAPRHERIPELLGDLTSFAARTDLPALVSTAIAHAQFETIHPFSDGNGRTGRALVSAMLRSRQVTRNVSVPVSAGLLADVSGYHQALTAYREGDPAPIVAALSEASLRAVANSRELISDLDTLREEWQTRLKVRRDSRAWELADLVLTMPVLNSRIVSEKLGVLQQNTYAPLRALTEAGILTSKEEHGQGPFWRSDEVLQAIDRFAERAGRRS